MRKISTFKLNNFISKLIQELFDGVLDGELQNEEKIIELKESLTMPNEKFIEKFISEREVREEILDIFDGDIVSDRSPVDTGSVYIEETVDTEEEPRIKELIEYEMKREKDYKVKDEVNIITEEGYDNIFNTVAINMAIYKKGLLREYVKKGVPKLVVSSGKINAKVIFKRDEVDNEKINGLKYSLYKKNRDGTLEFLSKGESNNLIINDKVSEKADIAILTGYILIKKADCYKFLFKNEKNFNLFIGDEEYLKGKYAFLEEGIYKIKIITSNKINGEFKIQFFMEVNNSVLKIDDNILFRDKYIEEKNEKINEGRENINLELIEYGSTIRYDLESRIGEVEIVYKVNTDV